MADKSDLMQCVVRIESGIETIKDGINTLPDKHDVDIDEIQGLIVDTINHEFDG